MAKGAIALFGTFNVAQKSKKSGVAARSSAPSDARPAALPSALPSVAAARRAAELAELKLKAARASQQTSAIEAGRSFLPVRKAARGGSIPTLRSSVEVLGVRGRDYFALSGSYAAAKTDRTKPGPTPLAAAADAHLDESQHDLLRRFSQDLYRSNGVAGMLIDRVADAVIGDFGPQLMCLSEDEAFNAAAEDYFWQWAQAPDVTGEKTLADLLRDMIADIYTDGDVGYAWTNVGKVQVIESERILQPANGRGLKKAGTVLRTPDGNTIIRGVEYGPAGNPVRYHVANFDENGLLSKVGTNTVGADSMFLVRSPFGRKSNQTRGVPVLSRIIDRLSQFEEYQNASLLASIVACNQALFIKSENPEEMQNQLEGATNQEEETNEEGYPITDLSPAMVAYLKNGEDIGQFTPEHPTTTMPEYSKYQMRLLGAQLGLPMELSMIDSSESNYYGTRASIANCYRGLAPVRRVVTWACQQMYRWVIGSALDSGKLSIREDAFGGWIKTNWICQPPPMIKTVEEVAGLADGVDRVLWDRSYAIMRATGESFRDVVRRRKRELAMERDAGIVPVTMPGAGGGTTSDKSAPDAQPTDQTGDGAADVPVENPEDAAAD